MKKTAAKVLSAVLCVVMLVSLIPGATAARQEDLRKVVVNQTEAIAEFDWRTLPSTRIARLDHPDAKKEAMHEAGVVPTTYFEYNRTHVALKGVIMENNAGTMEHIKASLVNGEVQKNANGDYLGMNVNSFLVDIVSRVSGTKFTTVKEAITSGALTSMLPAASATAASSAAAIAGISDSDLKGAYGMLQEGDLLIAWDDNAPLGEAPKLSVLVVTYLDGQNTGEVTVTYPAFLQPLYSFTCSKCGAKSTEGPTSAVPSVHVKADSSYAFKSFAKHSEVDSNTNCDGEFLSNGATTWYTETYTFDQLKTGFTGGGVGYIPYTVATYATGNAPEANVTVTTDATTQTLAGGFKATIASDYRIVQVDAVLSQPGKEDRVFTSYPDYADWTYDFANAELDKALFDSTTGSYTLALNVHTGPVTDPNKMEVPVVKAYKLELSLEAPSFEIVSPGTSVNQGQTFSLSVKTMVPGVTAARMQMKFDVDQFTFDLEKSRAQSPNATIDYVKGSNSVTIAYNGSALPQGGVIASPYFTAKRTGGLPIGSDKVDPFELASATVATGGDLTPARVGGKQANPGIGYNVVIHENYAGNNDLLLVFSEGQPFNITYQGTRMLDINSAHILVDGVLYSHAYAYVTPDADPIHLQGVGVTSSAGVVLPYLVNFNGDVNRSGIADINDVQCIQNIIDGTLPLDQTKYLLADVDHNGKVDTKDMAALLSQLKK